MSSFRTTLAAAREADAVLLVVDATDPVSAVLRKVETSLDELAGENGEAADRPSDGDASSDRELVPVLNKRDEATGIDEKRDAVRRLAGDPVVTSATEGTGIDALETALRRALPDRERVAVTVPNTDDGNAFVSWCHDHGTVHDPEYGDDIAFDFEARPEVAAKARGRADELHRAE